MNILYIFEEITPYMPESQISLIGRYLPPKVQEAGHQIRVFMPKYGLVKERRYQLHEVIRLSGMNIVVDDVYHSLIIKVASISSARMQIYFIDNEEYFSRKAKFYDENGKFFEDNDERVIFFAKGVMETIKKLRWAPDIVHINGWIGALIPLYIKKSYREDPIFHNLKVVTSIYNQQFDDKFDKNFKKKIKFDGFSDADLKVMENSTYYDLMKLSIKYSDGVIIENPDVSKELEVFANELGKKIIYQNVDPQNPDFEAYLSFYQSLQENFVKTNV